MRVSVLESILSVFKVVATASHVDTSRRFPGSGQGVDGRGHQEEPAGDDVLVGRAHVGVEFAGRSG